MGQGGIRADRDWYRGINIHIINRQKLIQARPIEWIPYEEHEILSPYMTISTGQAQLLMDDLWQAGLRPSEGTGSAGALRAVEKHLHDMRCIVFKNNPMDKT